MKLYRRQILDVSLLQVDVYAFDAADADHRVQALGPHIFAEEIDRSTEPVRFTEADAVDTRDPARIFRIAAEGEAR